MSSVFYSKVPHFEPQDARMDASGIFRLRKAEKREEVVNGTVVHFAAYSTTVKCASRKPTTHQISLRVYIHATQPDAEPYDNGTLISASGYLAFGVRNRGVSLHFLSDDVRVWKTDIPDPIGLGVVNCSFLGIIGPGMSKKSEGPGTTLRWEVGLLRQGRPFDILVVASSVDDKAAAQVKQQFVPGKLGFYTAHLAQLGLGENTKFPVFGVHTMQATSLSQTSGPQVEGPGKSIPVKDASKPASRDTSLSPTPPLSPTTRKRDLPPSSDQRAPAKRGRVDPSANAEAGPSTSRDSKSGRTVGLPIIDTTQGSA